MLNLEKDRTLRWLVAAVAILGVGTLSAMPPEFGDNPGAPWEEYEKSSGQEDEGFWDSWMGDEEQESATETIQNKRGDYEDSFNGKRDEYEDAFNEKRDEYEDAFQDKRDETQDWFEEKRSDAEEIEPVEEKSWWQFW